MATALGAEMLLVAVVDQGVQPVDAFDPDVAALAAVAAVGAAVFDELLAAEAHGTGAAMAAFDIDLGLIEELHRSAAIFSTARSKERRVGKECVSTCRSRGCP